MEMTASKSLGTADENEDQKSDVEADQGPTEGNQDTEQNHRFLTESYVDDEKRIKAPKMGSMFRSEEMALCQLFIQPEAAYSAVAAMGEAGVVQFRDLNSDVNAFQRKFVSEVRRCDELERKLRYIEAEVNKDKVAIPESTVSPHAPNPREIIDLESQLERTESEILELSHNAVNLKSNYLELTELKHVLEKTHSFFEEQDSVTPTSTGNDSITKALISEDSQQVIRGRLGFVAGVVPRERVPGFERMLWRISRGNVFLRRAELTQPLEDPSTGNEIFKTVFVAFFQGEQLKSRVKKVCSGYHASFYNCPSSFAERQDLLKGVKTRIEDLKLVLNQTHDHRQRVLTTVAKEIHGWSVMVRKMKAIYHSLNLFNMDVTKKCLIGECWVPVSDVPFIRQTLADGGKAVGSSIPSFLNVIETNEKPPTFNRTNKFTLGFQNLIDSYGIASYREVNPALYTIVTFPFLFSVMFGDAGHGAVLTAFAAFMIIQEKQLIQKRISSEIWNIFFSGRYIILLMGLFSIYTGLIYNDVFSKSVNIFGSSWAARSNRSLEQLKLNYHEVSLDPSTEDFSQMPYPIGLDPVWQLSTNKIIFLNSFKMKLSIILGVVHMVFGVTLSVVNHVHFKKTINIFVQFIPQFLFLTLLFFYLVSLMFVKWVLYGGDKTGIYSAGCAPSILITFIDMVMWKSKDPKEISDCPPFMFPSCQGIIQKVFLLIAIGCVPLMFVGKPFYIWLNRRQARNRHYSVNNGDLNQGIEMLGRDSAANIGDELALQEHPEDHDEEEEAMSEILIHQAIETIEYVLSTVSHTASYLRLWALSLAHAQLSEVLWQMVLHVGLVSDSVLGSISLYFAFGAWAIFTVAILVMMEGLSAFLHTLRLHWVEFMSKFYAGAGYPFQPFSFKQILECEESSDE